jgi:hypothetical protein
MSFFFSGASSFVRSISFSIASNVRCKDSSFTLFVGGSDGVINLMPCLFVVSIGHLNISVTLLRFVDGLHHHLASGFVLFPA